MAYELFGVWLAACRWEQFHSTEVRRYKRKISDIGV